MTLEQYAYRIAGPIDLVINLVINAGIALYFLWNVEELPVVGWHSASMFFAPMTFCVLTFATFFGTMNGVTQRKAGLGKGPVSADVPWARMGWKSGLRLGTIGLVLYLAALVVIDHRWPEWSVAGWKVIVLDGLAAGILGYAAQVNGVLNTERFPAAASPEDSEGTQSPPP